MKLIIDTNVLISGILKDKKPERVILFAAGNLAVDWIVSPEIMTEYFVCRHRKEICPPLFVRDDIASRSFHRVIVDISQKWRPLDPDYASQILKKFHNPAPHLKVRFSV